MRTAGIAAVMVMAAASAQAQDWKSLRSQSLAMHERCAYVGVSSRIMGTTSRKDADDAAACVQAATERFRAAYATLPAPTPGSADSALKSYMAAWMGAMQALPERAMSSEASARASEIADRQRLAELWSRFELELKP